MATRSRRDIQTAVAFLTTRVRSPDEDDWGKLKRILKYLNGTRYLKLRLTVESLGVLIRYARTWRSGVQPRKGGNLKLL